MAVDSSMPARRTGEFPPRSLHLLKSPELTLTIDELTCIVYAAVRAALDSGVTGAEHPEPVWNAVVPAVERIALGKEG